MKCVVCLRCRCVLSTWSTNWLKWVSISECVMTAIWRLLTSWHSSRYEIANNNSHLPVPRTVPARLLVKSSGAIKRTVTITSSALWWRKWFAVINVGSVKEMSPDIATTQTTSSNWSALKLLIPCIYLVSYITPIDVY